LGRGGEKRNRRKNEGQNGLGLIKVMTSEKEEVLGGCGGGGGFWEFTYEWGGRVGFGRVLFDENKNQGCLTRERSAGGI